jgi:hypothetical protein
VGRHIGFQQLVDNDRALKPGVGTDGLAWDFAGLPNNLDANVLVKVCTLQVGECLGSIEECRTSSRNDSLVRSSPSCAESVFNSVLELSDFDLRSSTNLDDSDTASEPAEPLLEFFLVVF